MEFNKISFEEIFVIAAVMKELGAEDQFDLNRRRAHWQIIIEF